MTTAYPSHLHTSVKHALLQPLARMDPYAQTDTISEVPKHALTDTMAAVQEVAYQHFYSLRW